MIAINGGSGRQLCWIFIGCSHIVEFKWSKMASSGKPGCSHLLHGDDSVPRQTDKKGSPHFHYILLTKAVIRLVLLGSRRELSSYKTKEVIKTAGLPHPQRGKHYWSCDINGPTYQSLQKCWGKRPLRAERVLTR